MMWCRGERRRMAMAHTLEESGSRQMSGTVGETYQARSFSSRRNWDVVRPLIGKNYML